MSDPIRLLVFMDTSTVSGPLRQLVASLDDLRREHAVIPRLVVCTRRGREVDAMRAYLAASGLDVVHLEERGRFDWQILARYRTLLREPSMQCVQTHGYKPTIYLAFWRILGVARPWVAFFHGRTYESRAVRVFDQLAIRCARWADRIVVVAESQRALFGGRTPVQHIPNAVQSRRTTVTTTPPAAANPLVLYVGRFSPEKGVDLLLQAMPTLVARHPQVRLRLVGDGPTRPLVEQLIATQRLHEHVELVGHVDDPSPYYAAARVLCLPSRSEGMPNVVLEAVAAGLPVVATAVGDVRSLVDDDLGRVVAPEDPQALADALDAELRSERGEPFMAARERLLQRFDRPTRARALRALYDALIDSAR